MRVEKGSFGYRNYHFLRNAGITALIALVIAVQIAWGRRVGGTLSIVLTLTGILCVLPMANVLSPLLAMMRYRTPERAFFEKTQIYSDRGILLYDLIFTTKEKAFPADAVLIRSGALLVCGPAGQEDCRKLKVHLENSLRLEHLKLHVNVYPGEEQFLKAIAAIPEESGCGDAELRTAALLKNLSY